MNKQWELGGSASLRQHCYLKLCAFTYHLAQFSGANWHFQFFHCFFSFCSTSLISRIFSTILSNEDIWAINEKDARVENKYQ